MTSESVWLRLLPSIQNMVDGMVWDEYDFIYNNRHEFMQVIRCNLYVYIFLLNKGKWLRVRLHEIVPPYSKTIEEHITNITNTNTNKIKISSVCLSCLLPNYPSKRAMILFNNLARINNEPTNSIFHSISGECILVPYYDPSYASQTINNWPSWDYTYFPSVFYNYRLLKEQKEKEKEKKIEIEIEIEKKSKYSPPSSPAFPTLSLPIPIPKMTSSTSSMSSMSSTSSELSPPLFSTSFSPSPT